MPCQWDLFLLTISSAPLFEVLLKIADLGYFCLISRKIWSFKYFFKINFLKGGNGITSFFDMVLPWWLDLGYSVGVPKNTINFTLCDESHKGGTEINTFQLLLLDICFKSLFKTKSIYITYMIYMFLYFCLFVCHSG